MMRHPDKDSHQIKANDLANQRNVRQSAGELKDSKRAEQPREGMHYQNFNKSL